MKILIFGGKGWIAGQFIDYLNSKSISYIISNNRINPDNEKVIIEEIINTKSTHVISLLGRTHGEGYNTIDYLEQNSKLRENINDNLYSPLLLAIICHKLNIHFTYLGTGCIYNGENIKEDDISNFHGSNYSIVKSYTDNLIKNFNSLNLRIRMPISSKPNPRNFITKIVSYEKICSITNSMTILDDFFPIFLDMMFHKLTGTYNCVNPNPVDHNMILSLYKEIVDKDFKWNNFTLEEQNKILKSGRSNNTLSTDKISSKYFIPDTLDSLKNLMIKYKNHLFNN